MANACSTVTARAHAVGLPGAGQREAARRGGARRAGRGLIALVGHAPEAQHLANPQRIHERKKEGRRHGAARALGGALRGVDPAVKQAQRLAPRRTPLPGHIPPDAPVVIVIGRGLGHLDAAASDADSAGGRRGEAGYHVAGDERIVA